MKSAEKAAYPDPIWLFREIFADLGAG